MKGWLLVGPEATGTARGLGHWTDFALERKNKGSKPATKPPAKRRPRRT
jgi:hypothetical protein